MTEKNLEKLHFYVKMLQGTEEGFHAFSHWIDSVMECWTFEFRHKEGSSPTQTELEEAAFETLMALAVDCGFDTNYDLDFWAEYAKDYWFSGADNIQIPMMKRLTKRFKEECFDILSEYIIKHPSKFYDSQDLQEKLRDWRWLCLDYEPEPEDIVSAANTDMDGPEQIVC